MFVTICVITYQRPEGLKRLMEGLNHLTFKQIPTPNLRVVVVDNDEHGIAYQFCQAIQPGFRWPLLSCIEPRRGISYARNRAVDCAPPDTTFIAFIDDDEVPEPDWLEQLLITQTDYQADVVHGPVIPYFPDGAPAWVKKGKFFEARRYPTGHRLEAAYTNNVLLRADLVKGQKTPFDERFALTGGEDSYLFRSLHHAGHSIVWANEAIVHEWIPNSRMTMRWILQRGYRSCLTYTLWEKEIKPSIQTKIGAIAKAIALILWGILLIPSALLLQRHRLIQSLLHICRGAGKISGLAGVAYEEYRVIHRV